MNTPEKKPVAATVSASSRFCWPSSREAVFPAPLPKVKPMAWITAIRGSTTLTAPWALFPREPTK